MDEIGNAIRGTSDSFTFRFRNLSKDKHCDAWIENVRDKSLEDLINANKVRAEFRDIFQLDVEHSKLVKIDKTHEIYLLFGHKDTWHTTVVFDMSQFKFVPLRDIVTQYRNSLHEGDNEYFITVRMYVREIVPTANQEDSHNLL